MADMATATPDPNADLESKIASILEKILPASLEKALAPFLSAEEGDTDGVDAAPTDESQYADGMESMDPAMQYADDMEMAPESEEDTESQMYASDPGGANTFTPGSNSICAPKAPSTETTRMQRDSERIQVSRYERALETANKRIADLEFLNRTTRYERTLTQLEAEGYEIDRAEEMAALAIDSPATFEATRESQIRKHYRRAPIKQAIIPSADPAVDANAPKPLSKEDQNRVATLAGRKGIPYSVARKELGL